MKHQLNFSQLKLQSVIIATFCLVILSVVSGYSQPITGVGTPPGEGASAKIVQFFLDDKAMADNGKISIKEISKESFSKEMTYTMNTAQFKKLKPNNVKFEITLVREGLGLESVVFKKAENTRAIALKSVFDLAQAGDNLVIELIGLPIATKEKFQTYYFKK